jgi:hypothetical protein
MSAVRLVALGLGLGVLVGGVLGRLAMFVLIRFNPEQVGTVSDDGFRMGQFTLAGSFNLLVVTGIIGAIGGLVYAGARHLEFGPRWFRLLSVVLGAALPVGGMLVHPDGVDFDFLQPTALAIGLFVAIPALFGLLIALAAERWLPAPGSWRRLEPLRWLLRAGVTVVLVVALAGLVSDVRLLV